MSFHDDQTPPEPDYTSQGREFEADRDRAEGLEELRSFWRDHVLVDDGSLAADARQLRDAALAAGATTYFQRSLTARA